MRSKALLFDLDGVFYQGETAIPGGEATLRWVSEQGIPHLFLSNTSSRPRQGLVDKLAAMGIHTDVEHLLTPPAAASRWLRTRVRGSVALFVPEATRCEFAGFAVWQEGEEQAAAVVIGDLGEAWDFRRLNTAFRLLMAEPTPLFVALGMTRYWRAPDGLRLDVAPFVVALQHASGVEPVVLGKPAAPFFATAAERLGVQPADCLMVGDDIRGDVQGAQRAGMRALLVRTGKFRPADLEQGITPDGVLDSVADLPAWWRAEAG
ncbi:TIGR01458 family HAD-type hydrolase [Thiohalobacter sp. IOR34]|uniref:TIGR01458 family HAD-type hydrolase n=1 Tax=Thiohalobacter sp. IOR34 TaxID=3057176 RepID=UPI0025B24913|nr:TIGR01458 family HAD-type hydrolase [Thiohalobacter sp. IOR34]WJW75400.1 TIGR01458 family HAD-type hydrolase [Thiohalobacter sp. IOR34]